MSDYTLGTSLPEVNSVKILNKALTPNNQVKVMYTPYICNKQIDDAMVIYIHAQLCILLLFNICFRN